MYSFAICILKTKKYKENLNNQAKILLGTMYVSLFLIETRLLRKFRFDINFLLILISFQLKTRTTVNLLSWETC